MKKFMMAGVMAVVLGSAALAQAAYDIRTMTPAVTAALEGRKGRFSELKDFKAQGLVGENNQGYVEALGATSQVKAVVGAENMDRNVIYQAIVEQNELGRGALSTVEAVFAGVQRDKAQSGEKVQDPSGKWVAK